MASAAVTAADAFPAPVDPVGAGEEFGGFGVVVDVPLPEELPVVGGFGVEEEAELPVDVELPLELVLPDALELPEEVELDGVVEVPEPVELLLEVEPVVDPVDGVGFGAFGLWTRVCARIGAAQRASETAMALHQAVRPSTHSMWSTPTGAPEAGAFILCSLKISFIISPRDRHIRSLRKRHGSLRVPGTRENRSTDYRHLPPS
jgi:hypothetical protein